MICAKKIVILMTDTQRRDMLGCYGNSDMKTPALDRLAAEGLLFDSAYTCQPVCGPARSAIFTGTYPHTNGSWGNSMPIGDNIKTLGQRMQDQGYHTAYIGKWHLDGSDYFGLGRCPDGWDPDYWYDMRNYLEEMTPAERVRSRKPEMMNEEGVPLEFTFGHRCSNRAINFLSKHAEEDFLLTVSYDEPHGPSLCPEPYASMYIDYEFPKNDNIWDSLCNKPNHQKMWAAERINEDKDVLHINRPHFFGCNSFVDSEIGRVLEAIEKYAPDALIVYTSDHGDFLESHSLNASKGPAMYDEICRIPLLIKWPGVTPAGHTVRHPVSHIDIVPTILQAASLEVPELLEGTSLCQTLANPAIRANERIYMEFSRYENIRDGLGGFQPIRTVFDGRYKLVINLMVSDELYDLETDPSEMQNLINDIKHACVRDALHDELLDWMNRTRDPFRGYYWLDRLWRTDKTQVSWNFTGKRRYKATDEYEPQQLDYSTGLPVENLVQ